MKNNRIPCPFCAEKIISSAKKCRYCGERLTKDSKKSVSKKFLYWVWFTSMAVFLVSLYFIRRASITNNSWLYIAVFLSLSGSIFFLLLVAKVLRSLKTKDGQRYGLATMVSFIAFFVLLANYERIEAALGFPPPQIQNNLNTPPPMNTVLPTTQPKPKTVPKNTTSTNSSNQITCTGPDGKSFQTTQQKCDEFNTSWGNPPTPNPNELVQCNIHPNCGGGYKEMTRSSCDQMICCTVDLNNTTKFISKDQCNKEQEQNLNKANSDACNTMCNFSTAICESLHEPGLQRADCVMEINSQKTDCLVSCNNSL